MKRHFAQALSALFTMALATTLSSQSAKTAAPPGSAAENPKVILVELFTSEGCSSCPPADALLRKLNGTRSPSGQLLVGISEHVTYWNSLGWADPFSAQTYSDRQSAYSDSLHLDGVYTPQMVINGTKQFVGSDEAALARAIRSEDATPAQVSIHILSATLSGSSLRINFSAAGEGQAHAADIMAIVTDDSAQSSVPRGENSGRTLTHVAVARSMQRIATMQARPEQTVQMTLPSSLRKGLGHHLIVFAQAKGTGRILGADSQPL